MLNDAIKQQARVRREVGQGHIHSMA
jgi:hypothetical protein